MAVAFTFAFPPRLTMQFIDANREKVLEWLWPGKFDRRHVEIRNIRLANTGKWIVNVLEQQDWTSKEGLLLLGTGDRAYKDY